MEMITKELFVCYDCGYQTTDEEYMKSHLALHVLITRNAGKIMRVKKNSDTPYFVLIPYIDNIEETTVEDNIGVQSCVRIKRRVGRVLTTGILIDGNIVNISPAHIRSDTQFEDYLFKDSDEERDFKTLIKNYFECAIEWGGGHEPALEYHEEE